ncbi:MAG TPA: hypothetical protein VF544_02555 [Pyrinomonadaceae bacterium]|jgi:hypothetical protein
MTQFFIDLWAFILAVLSNWVALMSGGIISVSLALWERHRKKNIPSKWYWALIAFFFVLLATFLAWRNERATLTQTQKELADAKKQKDFSLNGQIEKVIIDEGADVKGAQIFLLLSVRNIGDRPSIAEKYKLRIETVNFQDSGEAQTIDKEYSLMDKTEKIIVRPEESLIKKTNSPIPVGQRESGWLRFVVPHVKPDSIRQLSVNFTVFFTDVSGKAYSADYHLPESVK